MKITKIHLKDFHQFKDLTIDLTYLKGHEKEGQPLDKVCFIGQSVRLFSLFRKNKIYSLSTNVINLSPKGFNLNSRR